MRLSHDEEVFLRHWMYDEVHYENGPGPAKKLQLRNGVIPADLAILIAAAMPDPTEQEAAGVGPPPSEGPLWPWPEYSIRSRLAEARTILEQRRARAAPS
jgi:hypothetical protein